MANNSGSEQCKNWTRLSNGESQLGSNTIENFEDNNVNNGVDEIRNVSITAHNMIDPFKPSQVENSYADVFYQSSVLDENLRKCAGVDVLDSSIKPYSENIPVCDQYTCEAKNTAYEHPEDKCGNI